MVDLVIYRCLWLLFVNAGIKGNNMTITCLLKLLFLSCLELLWVFFLPPKCSPLPWMSAICPCPASVCFLSVFIDGQQMIPDIVNIQKT